MLLAQSYDLKERVAVLEQPFFSESVLTRKSERLNGFRRTKTRQQTNDNERRKGAWKKGDGELEGIWLLRLWTAHDRFLTIYLRI
jgi:hypothetical protein